MTVPDRFHLKDGQVSLYGLICGYQQVAEFRKVEDLTQLTVTLWHEGGPCFHVRAHEHHGRGRLFWNTYDSLTAARRAYRAAVRKAEKGEL